MLPLKDNSRTLNPASTVPKYFHFATVICERYRTAPVGTVLPALTELAERFSVSKETINRSMRYLAERGYVKSERGRGTQIIQDLGDALGLPSNTAPKAIHASEVQSVGLVLKARSLPQPDRHLAEIEIVAGLQHRLQQEGIPLATVVIGSAGGGHDLRSQLTSADEVGGFVFMTEMLNRSEAETVVRAGRPAVMVNETQFSDLMTCVVADEEGGMTRLIEHLVSLGHERISYLAASENEASWPRHIGYVRGMQAAGFKPDLLALDSLPSPSLGAEESTRSKVAHILSERKGFTAFVMGAPTLAVGFCKGLHDAGLKPGKDISVACFGYLEEEWRSIAEGNDKLTNVAKPRYEMGTCTAEVLLSQMRHGYDQTGVVRIPTSLMIGNTTGQAPQSSPCSASPDHAPPLHG
ncbi:MAG: LacI family DNA-binding transcriptional regulator [Verrucomicrobiota bacterium]